MIPPVFTYRGYRVQAIWELAGSGGYFGIARITQDGSAATILRTATSYRDTDEARQHAEGLARTWIDEQP